MLSFPVLSIIVPVYNVAQYLKECLNSLVKQNVSPASYEIICVDDGSKDGSSDIIDSFASIYSNIIVIHQDNCGVSAARNNGLKIAKGKYVWFVDGDDFIADYCLDILLPELNETLPDLLYIRPIVFQDGIDTNHFHSQIVAADATSISYEKWLWTRLYSMHIINESGVRFHEGLAFAEDNLFCAQLRPFIKNEIQLDRIAYFYRKRKSSVSGTPTKEKLDLLINACTVFIGYYKSEKISQCDAAFIICPTMISIMYAVAYMSRKEEKNWLQFIKKQGLFPLKKQYRNKQEYDKNGLNPEKRVLLKLKYHSYTIPGYYMLRVFRFFLKIKRRIKIELFHLSK